MKSAVEMGSIAGGAAFKSATTKVLYMSKWQMHYMTGFDSNTYKLHAVCDKM